MLIDPLQCQEVVVVGAGAAGAAATGGAGFGLISTFGNAVFRLSSKFTVKAANP
jgi:hypothetical protein